MLILPPRSRLILSALIIFSFFLPSYEGVSAFGFVGLAIAEAKAHAEITLVDVLILLTPLIFIPVVALVIGFRSVTQVPVRTTVIGLPLLLLLFFFALLSYTGKSSNIHIPASDLFFSMQIGFYVAAISSLLLVFTKDGGMQRHKRKRRIRKMATAAID
ncbi:MAG TPA: hypothetical protein VM884_06965 [Flavisolibacter sp.]|nr:hypothetical protein [Flavisolibacter sp.]